MANIILCLGGDLNRNTTAASLAASLPTYKVLVSSEGSPETVARIYENNGVQLNRVYWDFHAWDTLTNFTLTLPWILAQKPNRLAIVTSDFHMKRSMTIAQIIYAFRGITLNPYSHQTQALPEPSNYIGWDRLRALTWRTTGYTIENGDREKRMQYISAEGDKARALGLQVL